MKKKGLGIFSQICDPQVSLGIHGEELEHHIHQKDGIYTLVFRNKQNQRFHQLVVEPNPFEQKYANVKMGYFICQGQLWTQKCPRSRWTIAAQDTQTEEHQAIELNFKQADLAHRSRVGCSRHPILPSNLEVHDPNIWRTFIPKQYIDDTLFFSGQET